MRPYALVSTAAFPESRSRCRRCASIRGKRSALAAPTRRSSPLRETSLGLGFPRRARNRILHLGRCLCDGGPRAFRRVLRFQWIELIELLARCVSRLFDTPPELRRACLRREIQVGI